jgi:hypothetical protein
MLKTAHTSIERFLLSPAYFVLFSLYPVLGMYANNVHGILLVDLFRPLIISLAFALLVYSVLQLTTHHSQTSALIVLVVLLAFFYYGHIRNLLNSSGVYIPDKLLATTWLFMSILALALIGYKGKRWNSEMVAAPLNIATIILLLFPSIKLSVYTVANITPLKRKSEIAIQVDTDSASPDIYYIILDSYVRSDVMKDGFGYDNTPFINSLRDMGFYVADCSQANYGSTSLSLSSTLNMDYLQNISDSFQPQDNDLLYAFKALDANVFRKTLTDAGYETVAFASGFNWIEWRDADHFITPKQSSVTEFETTILLSSYARILDDLGIVNLDDVYAEHYRQRTRLVLDSFDELLKLPSPKFVFIHIIAPHDPYGLDKNGNNVIPDQIDELTGYSNQAKFISTALLPHLQKVIDESANPPVIILQGDHGRTGSDPDDLMKILNAYYLPGHTDQLYSSISPVNTFRVVLNSYFGTDLPLLEDVSYYSTFSQRYDFSVRPNACPRLAEVGSGNGATNALEVVR